MSKQPSDFLLCPKSSTILANSFLPSLRRADGLRVLVFVLPLIILFAGCSQSLDPPKNLPTTLTIINDSDYDLTAVRWVDWSGVEYEFTSGQVYDEVLPGFVDGLAAKSRATVAVEAGEAPLVFFLATGGGEKQTVEAVSVSSGQQASYFIDNDTEIMEK